MAGGPDKEDVAATSRVRIHDIEPSVLKALLHFIYTDSLPEIDASDKTIMTRRLLVAAQRYEMKPIKNQGQGCSTKKKKDSVPETPM